MNAFHPFKRDGVKYLAVPLGNNCMICDDAGNNYGSYFDQASFEKMAERDGGFEKLKLGKCVVSINCR